MLGATLTLFHQISGDSIPRELNVTPLSSETNTSFVCAVAAVPTILKQDSLEKFFRKVIDAAADDRTPHLTKVRDKLIATIACHAAIKIHRPLTGAEMSRVVGDLLGSSNPFACPHGRPIIVDIRHIDIERHFHRK